MDRAPRVAPVLSTPDTHIFEAPAPTAVLRSNASDAELDLQYEILRTIRDIKRKRWKRIALQFPDNLLPDASRVYGRLQIGLRNAQLNELDKIADQASSIRLDTEVPDETKDTAHRVSSAEPSETLYILADTSYGACCVDEVAAQHVNADVVVHYGRACLSPTSHMPALHIFTVSPLPLPPLIEHFQSTFPDHGSKIILTSDVTYSAHLTALHRTLKQKGYSEIFVTDVEHDPSSLVPNRTVPTSDLGQLREWSMFHIGNPPQALLLTLASRLSKVYLYPSTPTSPTPGSVMLASTSLALRRRYALLTRLSRAAVIGILINTLSVHAYMKALNSIQNMITNAGKKFYVFVVGKLNAAKIANFAEVDGWVVVGCWESSLVESSDFEKPIVVPFELELALKGDQERVWTGEWRGDFDELLRRSNPQETGSATGDVTRNGSANGDKVTDPNNEILNGDYDSEEESEPPEFDLRTGRYIQHSRPMRQNLSIDAGHRREALDESTSEVENKLVKRARGDLAKIGGEVSPGAEFLREKRTWRGLGSDFEIGYERENEPVIKEGRSGIARGYENEK